jgi:hypothetical protein
MDKNLSNEDKELSLNYSSNYRKNIGYANKDILKIYNSILSNCIKHAKENLSITNRNYLIYVLKNCVFVVNEVFLIILINTKNLELVVHFAQKAFFFYIEFMGQIGDNNHNFLKLSSSDAKLFVYKKTLYDLKRDSELSKEEITKINHITEVSDLVNLLVYSYLNNINNLEDLNFISTLFPLLDLISVNYNNNMKQIIEYLNNEIAGELNGNEQQTSPVKEIQLDFNYNDLLDIQMKLIKKMIKKNNFNKEVIIKKIKNLFLNNNFSIDEWNSKIINRI